MTRQQKGFLLLVFMVSALFIAARYNHTKSSSTATGAVISQNAPDPKPVPTPTRPETARVVVKTVVELNGCHHDDFILLATINDLRANEGLKPYAINGTLNHSARLKSAHIIAKGYWAHVAPDGTTPWDFFNEVGYKYETAGENLARNFSCDEQMVSAFMESPTHRDNILNPYYKEIGIGREGDIVTLHFGLAR